MLTWGEEDVEASAPKSRFPRFDVFWENLLSRESRFVWGDGPELVRLEVSSAIQPTAPAVLYGPLKLELGNPNASGHSGWDRKRIKGTLQLSTQSCVNGYQPNVTPYLGFERGK